MENKLRKEHAKFVGHDIVKISAGTKKSLATITLNIPDELAEELLRIGDCPDGYPKIMSLMLMWVENLSDKNTE